MSSKENKRQAQQRRAEERERAQKRVVRNRILIGIVAVCFVGFLIYMTVREPSGSADEDALKSDTMTTEEDTTSEAVVDAIEEAADAAQAEEPALDTTEGREVQEGDTVAIDYVGTKDGVAFDGGTGNYDLTIGSGAFIDGFEDGLIGKKVGETVDLDLTFPENYGAEELAGQDVVFTVTINGIYDE